MASAARARWRMRVAGRTSAATSEKQSLARDSSDRLGSAPSNSFQLARDERSPPAIVCCGRSRRAGAEIHAADLDA
jgi:hypothetical protein